jgi:hypothetical protein
LLIMIRNLIFNYDSFRQSLELLRPQTCARARAHTHTQKYIHAIRRVQILSLFSSHVTINFRNSGWSHDGTATLNNSYF